ncbi:RtcB family protein [Jatrophihabitans sp. DSM 45814]
MERISDKLVSWASILEDQTRAQACQSATMDFIYPHLALMPDAHLGLGATVGSVIPTQGAIMPAAVGVDIGCGMMAVRTEFKRADVERRAERRPLGALHSQISKAVPLSAGAANDRITDTAATRIAELEAMPGISQAEQALPHWRKQLGTLGSGNHFIEVSLDEEDRVWMFLHSGSRGVGNRLAGSHIKAAQAQCNEAGVRLPHRDLAYLVEATPEFDSYIEALNWSQHFALLNRDEMMDRVVDQVLQWFDVVRDLAQLDAPVRCHHNYTVQERHFDRDVWLSRKGAISARLGEFGLIPGSMGDRSYVVEGKGNADSLCSAPHGAGRNFSRTAARKRFTRADLDERMAGVAWGESDAFLDEHPEAYKPIDVVMRDAEPLVDVVHELRQIVNVKGN